MPIQGVRNILRFNWPFYAAAALTAAAAAFFLPNPLAILAFGIATYFAIASLVASHLVYDTPAIYGWQWLLPILGNARTILNVHAGFDETTTGLRRALPGRVQAFEFYDRTQNTESSIARAQTRNEATRFRTGSLPCRASGCDAILFLFAAHEIRQPDERDRCLTDVARVLRDNGRVVILEHLRDLRTLAVFGPGAFHFYSRREWLRVAAAAQLTLVEEKDLTPFAHYFVFERRFIVNSMR